MLQKVKFIIAILLPFIGINQFTHWIFPLLSIFLLITINKLNIRVSRYFMMTGIMFCIWIYTTGVLSGNPYHPIRKLGEIILVIIWSILIINSFIYYKDTMLKSIYTVGVLVSVFLLLSLVGGVIEFETLPFGKNGIALFLFTSLIFSLGLKGKKKNLGFFLILVAIIFTASLKVIFATLIVLIYLLKSFINKKASIIILFILCLSIYNFSKINSLLLNSRVYAMGLSKAQVYVGLEPELAFANDYRGFRKSLIKGGMDLFYKNPVLGIGMENSRLFLPTYTHNHFVELLASLGIFGFLIFSLFLYPFYVHNLRSINLGLIIFFAFILIGWSSRLYDNYSFFLLISFGWSTIISKKSNHIFSK